MRHLMNRYAEFGIYMTYLDLGISPSQNMRINTNTNRNIGMFSTELFQNRKVIYIYLNTHFSNLFNFFKGDSIWGVENFRRFKSCFQSQSYFLIGYSVQACTLMF